MEVRRIIKQSDFIQEHRIVGVIRCPICHRGKLLDATDEADMSAIHLFSSGQKNVGQWYIKCPKCGRQIGITFGRSKQMVH